MIVLLEFEALILAEESEVWKEAVRKSLCTDDPALSIADNTQPLFKIHWIRPSTWIQRFVTLKVIALERHNARRVKQRRDGRYWTRTSDPCGVNTVLYRLS